MTPSDLSGVQRERDVLKPPVAAELLDPQQLGAWFVDARARVLIEPPTEHMLRKGSHVEARRRPIRDLDAVAKDNDAFADGEDLGQLVADENHGDAVRLEATYDIEQRLDFAFGQRRGRLVHGDQPGALNEGAGDRHDLLVGDAQLLDQRVQRHVDADHAQPLLGDPPDRPPGNQSPALRQLVVEGDVLGDRQVGKQGKILIDHLEAGAHRVDRLPDRSRPPVHFDGSRVRRHHAGEDLDESRLAASVLAGETDDLARFDGETDLMQRMNAGKRLAHALHTEQLLRRHGFSRPNGGAAPEGRCAVLQILLRTDTWRRCPWSRRPRPDRRSPSRPL